MFMSPIGRRRLQEREKKIMAYYDDMGPGKGNCTVGHGSLVRRSPCTPEELRTLVTEAQVQQLFMGWPISQMPSVPCAVMSP